MTLDTWLMKFSAYLRAYSVIAKRSAVLAVSNVQIWLGDKIEATYPNEHAIQRLWDRIVADARTPIPLEVMRPMREIVAARSTLDQKALATLWEMAEKQ